MLLSNPTLEKPAYAGVRAARGTTGAVAGGGAAEIPLAWPKPFLTTEYTVVASVEENTPAASTLRVRRIVSRSLVGVVVGVYNEDALNARTGMIHAIGIPD